MLAKELIKILQQNPEAEVNIEDHNSYTTYVNNVKEVKLCNVEEDNGTYTCESFVLVQGQDILVYSGSNKFSTE